MEDQEWERGICLSLSSSYRESIRTILARSSSLRRGSLLRLLPLDLIKQVAEMCFSKELVLHVTEVPSLESGCGLVNSPLHSLSKAEKLLQKGLELEWFQPTDSMPKISYDCAMCEEVTCNTCSKVLFCPDHLSGACRFSRELKRFIGWGGVHDFCKTCQNCHLSINANCQDCFKPCHMCERISTIPQRLQAIEHALLNFSQEDSLVVRANVQAIRQLLSIERNPPIDEVIGAHGVPVLAKLLHLHDYPAIQFETLWALCNIASGTSAQAMEVVKANTLELFVQLLDASDMDVKEQAIWALGNIAGDGSELRDLCIEAGMIEPVIRCASLSMRLSMVRNASWALSNLCRGRPQADFATLKQIIPVLVNELVQSDDVDVMTDACWALSYLSDGTNDQIEEIVSSGALPHMMRFLKQDERALIIPALRTVGNIATGTDAQTQHLLDLGLLDELARLLSVEHQRQTIIKEACWTVSNIASGSPAQVEAMFAHPTLVEITLVCGARSQQDIAREVGWAFLNVAATTEPQKMVQWMIEHPGILKCGLNFLARANNNHCRTAGLEFLEKMTEISLNLDDETKEKWVNGLKGADLKSVVTHLLHSDDRHLSDQTTLLFQCLDDTWFVHHLQDDDSEAENEAGAESESEGDDD